MDIKGWVSNIKTSNGVDVSRMAAVPFKMQHTFDNRLQESARVIQLYGTKIPVICERAPRARLAQIKKRKYLVPRDLTVGQFMYVIRKHMQMPAEQTIYLYIGGHKIYSSSTILSDIYEKEKDRDGFLYVVYNSENVFGM